MVPYIFIFSLNYILAYYADKKFVANKFLTVICLITIGILNVFFVGCRDFGVGYDTNVYIEFYFDVARSVTDVMSFINAEIGDKGYLLLAFISTMLSKDPQSLLFVTEAFIITLTLAGLYNYKHTMKIDISTYILLYWLILFFFSMNFMRQYCAMAILFYGYSYWQRGEKSVYVFFQVIAFFFHSSSFLFVFVPVLDYMSKVHMEKKVLFSVCVLAFMFLSTFSFYTILAFMGDHSVINEVYLERYSIHNHGFYSEGTNIKSILLILIQVYLYVMAKKDKSMNSPQLYMMLMLYLITYFAQSLVTINVNLNRVALYFNQIYLLYLSLCLKTNNDSIKTLLKYSLLLMLLIVCVNSSFNHKYETHDYTYSSKILGINR